jgi:FkbM family methyltransferase
MVMRQRLSGDAVVVPYVGDAVLVWPKESSSVGLCAKYGLGEYTDMAFCLHFLRPGDLFTDLGANSGVYTVLASKVAGAHSVAVEPVPATHALLRRNIEANDIGDLVDARQCGVGSKSDNLHFTASLWSLGHVADAAGEDTVAVPVEPLDTILAGRVPALIKVDVEGFEGAVVEGANATLSDPACKAVILELAEDVVRYGVSGADVVDMMTRHGFTPYWYDPAARKLEPAGRSGPGKWNKIFIRDLGFVEDRLATSPAFDVRGVSV